MDRTQLLLFIFLEVFFRKLPVQRDSALFSSFFYWVWVLFWCRHRQKIVPQAVQTVLRDLAGVFFLCIQALILNSKKKRGIWWWLKRERKKTHCGYVCHIHTMTTVEVPAPINTKWCTTKTSTSPYHITTLLRVYFPSKFNLTY